MPLRSRSWLAIVVASTIATGWTTSVGTAAARPTQAPTPVALGGPIDLDVERARTCDPLDPRHCLLPFPSDFFTRRDPSTATGRRVAFPKSAMPVNADGVRIDPTEWNRNDGFSPGPSILTFVPGLDPDASGVPPVTDIGSSLEASSAVVLLDADTGERVPLWAELDANASSDGERLLMARPARNLVEGHRHVVALRNLLDRDREPIPPGDVFRAYRDRRETENQAVERRRPAMERIFDDLAAADVARDDLWLAWDFTVASEESLAGRLLHMRDDAFDTLDGHAPDFTVDSVEDEGAIRIVRGTYEVPSYLTGDGGPGTNLNNGNGGDDPLPRRNGTIDAEFICTVPQAATAADPARWGVFGHGLLGSAEQVLDVGRIAVAVNAGFCATPWIGMSRGDVAFLGGAIGELTKWRAVPDRLQQAHLNFLVLGKLVLEDDGLVSHEAFQDDADDGVIDRSNLVFIGGSQGGILGGATSAVATDWTRAFLAVAGLDYSLLLNRSNQFDPFEPVFAEAYPDLVERTILLGVMQMLWDRGENNAYANHLTRDPYPGTPKKKILLFEAFGDFQVANVATEVLARTIGARIRQPALADGRSTAVEPFWGILPIEELPFDGSALVVWDYGTAAPPVENIPPRDGVDPHDSILRTIAAVFMASDYLKIDGVLRDVCDAKPCRT